MRGITTMRRRIGFALATLLTLSLLAGCGGSGTSGGSSAKEKPWKPGDKTELIFATGGTGGADYLLAAAWPRFGATTSRA
jgi:hypothetical protein